MTDTSSNPSGPEPRAGSTMKDAALRKQSRGINRDTLWLLAIAAAFVMLYGPTFKYLWSRWEHDTQYSLAYLVPFVSGYFMWRLWKEAISQDRSRSGPGLLLVSTAMLIHMVGTLLDVAVLSGMSIIVFLIGASLCLRGVAFTRTLWFPLAYTVFMIPLPEGITDMVGFPLQLYASASTAHLIRLLGIDIMRNGVNMSVPGFDFEVAAACSGMSSLVALVGVMAVFAYITNLPAKYRWLLFALSLPIALVANVVRITTIALIGYWVGAHVAIDIYHDWSSPILFMVAILLLFAISRGFEWLNDRQTTH